MRNSNLKTVVLVILLVLIAVVALFTDIARINKEVRENLENEGMLAAIGLENEYKYYKDLGSDHSEYVSTDSEKECFVSEENENFFTCSYTLDSDTGKAKVILKGKEDSVYRNFGAVATSNSANIFEMNKDVTITLNYQNNEGWVSYLEKGKTGDTYSLLNLKREGFSFTGWYTEKEGGRRVYSSDTILSDITLYAHYVETVELDPTWKKIISGKKIGSLSIDYYYGDTSNIKSIKFYNNDSTYDYSGKTFIANVSSTGETIKVYGMVDSTDSTLVDIDIVGETLISFPSDSSELFSNLNYLETIDFNNAITTSNVTTMNGMFYDCEKLINLDVSSFDTSNVIDMSSMFGQAGYTSEVFTLDVSNFDTSKVTDMSYMFYRTGSSSTVFTLDLSNFDTSNVTDMSGMFREIGYNESFTLNLNNFDTSNVTDMHDMFYGTGEYGNKVFTLDLSHFDTSNVTNMSCMFYETGGSNTAFTLDLSNFDTSKVTDMHDMFFETGYSSTVFTLDLSNFDTSSVTNMAGMFYRTAKSNPTFTLDLSHFDTSKVTDMSDMFFDTGYSSTIFTLDLSSFNTYNVTNMQGMFACTGYSSTVFTLDLSNFDTSNVTNMSWMFARLGYSSTTFTLDLSNFDTSNVTTMAYMFENFGTGAQTIYLDLSNFDTSNVVDMSYMFYGTGGDSEKIEIQGLNNLDTSNVVDMTRMFECFGDYCALNGGWWRYRSTKTGKIRYPEFNLEVSILNKDADVNNKKYKYVFNNPSNDKSSITINYTLDTSKFVDDVISDYEDNNDINIIKGELLNLIEPNITTKDIYVVSGGYKGIRTKLASYNKNLKVVSFKLNGETIEGDSFIMPDVAPTISDVVTK